MIGVNIQDPKHPPTVTTKDDVAAWSTDRFVRILKRQGFEIVDSGETRTLQGEVEKLLVTEDSLFVADVEFTVVVKNTIGESVFRGGIEGRSKRWGRTYNLENYYEAFTNAFEDAVKELAESPTFMTALRQ